MKNNRVLFLITLIVISLCSMAQENNTQKLVVPLTDPGKKGILEVDLVNGGISVNGYNGKEVVIIAEALDEDELKEVTGHVFFGSRSGEGRSRTPRPDRVSVWVDHNDKKEEKEGNVNRSTEGMKKIGVQSFQLTAEEKDNHVNVQSDSWRQAVNLKIQVPENFDLILSTINEGEIVVTNVNGMIELENINGPVTATGISGAAVINTTNGSMKVDFDKITGDTPMSFTTMNGDVELLLPSSTKAVLKMKSEMGEIFTDFDLDVKQHDPKVEREKGSGKFRVSVTKWIYGEINGGGPEFTLQSMHGDFYIRKK